MLPARLSPGGQEMGLRLTPRGWWLLALVLLGVASDLFADTFVVARAPATVRASRSIYGFVPTVRVRESWATRQLRLMRDFANSKQRPGTYPDARTAETAFGDPHDFERQGQAYGTTSVTSLMSGGDLEYGVDDGPSLAIPTEVITPEEFLQTLTDLPKPALDAASVLVAYADGVLFLVLNLRVLFLDEIYVDWDALLRNSELTGQEAWIVSHEKSGKKKKKHETPDATAATRRAVRSTFRIVAGVFIGLMLWFIVRKL